MCILYQAELCQRDEHIEKVTILVAVQHGGYSKIPPPTPPFPKGQATLVTIFYYGWPGKMEHRLVSYTQEKHQKYTERTDRWLEGGRVGGGGGVLDRMRMAAVV